ncbi:MAG: acyl-CoA thioesterase [Eubacterium sp.]|nr:acyl-CoA thioesterase [Candidatus Colimonas fimequi]
MWTFERKVRYYETDRMGVVHQSNYMRILEDARMDWIDEHIMKYSDMEKMGIIVPAVSSLGNFKAFLRFDDHFTVSVKLVEYTGVRIKFVYEVRNIATGELCYDGYTTHCFTRDGDYKPIPIRRKFPEIHEKFLACVEVE